jgi:sulfate adenylyltransferase (ADP) / ATP adenylyltransferase
MQREVFMLSRIRAVSAAARETGALVSFETEYEVVNHVCRGHPADGEALPARDIPFLIRTVQSLARKDAAAVVPRDPVSPAPYTPRRDDSFNPFLPYETAMFVQELPPSHVLLLNKFNVVENHTLVVTKDFEEQSSLLTARDFTAMWDCLHADIDGLAFYNAGKIAGASQRHKHLQVVPCPLIPIGRDFGNGEARTPFDSVFDGVIDEGIACSSSPYLPFMHRAVRMDDCAMLPPARAGELTMSKYTELIRTLGTDVGMACQLYQTDEADDVDEMDRAMSKDESSGQQPFSYNLLVTRAYMWMVPRRRECFRDESAFQGKISVNSLGFAGCLLVRDAEQLKQVRRSPMQVLEYTSFPRLSRGVAG